MKPLAVKLRTQRGRGHEKGPEVSQQDGLDDLRLIIKESPAHLAAGGWLLLEHGYDQAEVVRDLLLSEGFDGVHSRIDLGGHERITLGCRPC